MRNTTYFEFYKGHESDQFSFYRIPKQLVKDKRFSALSDAAKILYGLLLDRMGLSARNGWIDENDHVFIIYTIEQIREDLGWGRDKAINALAELDSRKGIGLIERVKRGLGKPDIIFVKNFASGTGDGAPDDEHGPENGPKNDETDDTKGPKKAENPHKSTEVGKVDFKKSENPTSGGRETRLQEVGKADSNNTDINKTDNSDTDLIYLSGLEPEDDTSASRSDGWIDRMHALQEQIRAQIDYVSLLSFHRTRKEQIDEIIDLLVDVYLSKKNTIRIGRENKPRELVLARYDRLGRGHIEYVLESLARNTKPIISVKNHLLTTLYNATLTSETSIQAEVNHDFYGEDDPGSGAQTDKPARKAAPFLQGSLAADLDLIEELAMKNIAADHGGR
ncbi:MAG: replication initiator protein A [Eubacterium sp.]|nr:replication initiator protein A [Eubacterium sp.]